MKRTVPTLALLAIAATASAVAAFETGSLAFTKRAETKLLAEPKPLAATAATLPSGRQVRVEAVQGAWLRVSADDAAGWVFKGNLTATKPAEVSGLLDNVPLAASETTATAAARPLSSVASDYAEAQSLSSAKDDLEWVIGECDSLTEAEVDAYLQAQKKGEFQ